VVHWDDLALGIDWGLDNPIVSARDAAAQWLADIPALPSFEGD
jgi:dTDP-4-dehydrorhamnose 3,5-epimerase